MSVALEIKIFFSRCKAPKSAMSVSLAQQIIKALCIY
jgi:hypothetical protein